ncbi:MAG: hypothetical protein Q8P74_00750 [bacterium]|nr:hypothetical protein [bacterium]
MEEKDKKEKCPLCNVSEDTLEKLRGKRQLEETTVKEKPKKRFWRRLFKGKS